MSINKINATLEMFHGGNARRILTALIFYFLFAAHLHPAPALAEDGHFCEITGVVSLNSVQDVVRYDSHTYDLFVLNVPEPGVLILEVADLAQNATVPVIDGIGSDCTAFAANTTVSTTRSAPRRVVKVEEPGEYFFRVGTSHVGRGVYRLAAGFAAGRDLPIKNVAGEDPCSLTAGSAGKLAMKEIDELDPEILTLTDDVPGLCLRLVSYKRSRTKEIDELDPEILTVSIAEPGVLEINGDVLRSVRPGRYFLLRMAEHGFLSPREIRARFYPICGAGQLDDHGDSFACATRVRLGTLAAARLDSEDFDTFSFRVSKYSEVAIETDGDVDTHGRLFDENGTLLGADDDSGRNANFRLAMTLVPGRYFLRVEGIDASQGPFILTTASSDARPRNIQAP